MKKFILDLTVSSVETVHQRYVLIKLTHEAPLPNMLPGQFVEVRVDDSPATFLRRPISICFVDRSANELWLLVAVVGEGTRRLSRLQAGDILNCILPLGNGFTVQEEREERKDNCEEWKEEIGKKVEKNGASPILLVGGGVGVAPLLYLGAELARTGAEPIFLLGARRADDLLLLDEFKRYGRVYVTTEDGSLGEQGFVTNHSILSQEHFCRIATCGPTPMMKAVARYARETETACEASLENMMACGLGACLCCVEKVRIEEKGEKGEKGEKSRENTANVCVCKEGPVFNILKLLWQN